MNIKVKVTKKDIKKGQRASSENCPVALAIKRALGAEDAYVNVESNATITLYGDLPKKVLEFIEDFDYGTRLGASDIRGERKYKVCKRSDLKPFTFTLKLE